MKTLFRQVQTLIEMHCITRSQKAALSEKEHLKPEAHAGRERFQKLVDQAATGIIETDADSCITLEARRENGEAVILNTDSGIGTPAEFLPDVFNLLSQVRRSMPHAQGGLGIGLSLVKTGGVARWDSDRQ